MRLFLEGRAHGPGARAARAHGSRRRARAYRRGGQVSRPASPRSKRSRSGRRWPPPRATTPTSSAITAEPPLVAVNLFHLRGGQIVDRREFFWEDSVNCGELRARRVLLLAAEADLPGPAVRPARSFTCRWISKIAKRWRRCCPRSAEPQSGNHTPQRGQKKRSLIDLVGDQREAQLRRALPRAEAVVAGDPGSAAGRARACPTPPKRIECFDISHIQGTDKVASMVVWEDGRMKKSDYRKFIIRTVKATTISPPCAKWSTRRYGRCSRKKSADAGPGSDRRRHRAVARGGAKRWKRCGIIDQPLASIAKREEMIYVLRAGGRAGRARPLLAGPAPGAVDSRRGAPLRRDVPPQAPAKCATAPMNCWRFPASARLTTRRLLQHFGSVKAVREADAAALSAVVNRTQAEAILNYFKAHVS